LTPYSAQSALIFVGAGFGQSDHIDMSDAGEFPFCLTDRPTHHFHASEAFIMGKAEQLFERDIGEDGRKRIRVSWRLGGNRMGWTRGVNHRAGRGAKTFAGGTSGLRSASFAGFL
jgi:hypothetical protein